MAETDRIEKEIFLRAPRSRVWRALTDAEAFGSWFGCRFDGMFTAGQPLSGHITSKGYEHLEMTLVVQEIAPEVRFSFRWHPYAIDPAVDYSGESMTLVTFELRERDGGTQLSIVESGFDALPDARRAEAFRMNQHGWDAQLSNIGEYAQG